MKALFLSTPLLLSFLSFSASAFGAPDVADIKNQYPPCTQAPTKEAEQSARDRHGEALAAAEKLDWAEAVRLWNAAYAVDCSRPRVFKYLGNAYEQLGDLPSAIATYELLVERAPTEIPDDLPPHLHELRIAHQKAKEASANANPSPSGSNPTPTPSGTDKPNENGAAGPTETPPPPSGSTETTRPLGVFPWVTVGVGGGAAVAGGVLLGLGLSGASSAEEGCKNADARTGCTQEAVDDGEASELKSQIGQGLLIGGGAVAVLGIVLQFAANGEEPVTAAQNVVPFVSESSAGLTWRGSF